MGILEKIKRFVAEIAWPSGKSIPSGRPAAEIEPGVEQQGTMSQMGHDAKGDGNVGIGAGNIGSGANKKPADLADSLASSSVVRNSGLSTYNQYTPSKKLVKGPYENLINTVEVGGIAPLDSWLTSPSPHYATPTANSLYQENLQSTNNEIFNNEAAVSKIKISCPYCSSSDFVKRGTRQKKREKVQLYICKACGRTFTPFSLKGKHYPLNTILDAISYYNLGFSLEQTAEILKKTQNIDIQPSTVASWYEEHKEICAYHRMRPFAVKEFSPYEVVETCTLAHRQLYRYRFHRAKTKYILEDDFKHYKFYPLKEFLELVPGECPHQYFQRPAAEIEPGVERRSLGNQILRASETPIRFSKTEMIVRSKENFATKLATLVLQGVIDNKQRHEILQKFLLANDSVTVATEVPVYIRREDLAHMQTQLGFELYRLNPPRPSFKKEGEDANSSLSKGRVGGISDSSSDIENKSTDTKLELLQSEDIPRLITGHIDFLQIRNGSIHILDYKSNAAKERPIEQLTLYALALSRLTGIRVFHFKCAWFDEKDYFEFFPLHVVYKPRRGRKKVYTKEGEYDINQRADRIEHLGPNWTKKSKGKVPF